MTNPANPPGGEGKLTKAQRAFLNVLIDGPAEINEIAYLCHTRASSVSMTRNVLLARGLVAPWNDYAEPVRITKAGRAAILRATTRTGD